MWHNKYKKNYALSGVDGLKLVSYKAHFDNKLIKVYICQACVQERYSPLIT